MKICRGGIFEKAFCGFGVKERRVSVLRNKTLDKAGRLRFTISCVKKNYKIRYFLCRQSVIFMVLEAFWAKKGLSGLNVLFRADNLCTVLFLSATEQKRYSGIGFISDTSLCLLLYCELFTAILMSENDFLRAIGKILKKVPTKRGGRSLLY